MSIVFRALFAVAIHWGHPCASHKAESGLTVASSLTSLRMSPCHKCRPTFTSDSGISIWHSKSKRL